MREHWLLDRDLVFLNHGSFGACPTAVLEHQSALRRELEGDPVAFFLRRLPGRIDETRSAVGAFVGAAPQDVVFVRNATEAANAVLRSLRFFPGDEIVVTSHGYNAVSNVARFVAERSGARVSTVKIPFPIDDPAEATEAVLGAVTRDTRLAIVDHVTSPTGLVLPIDDVVRGLRQRGVECFVDGAHGPVMLPLGLDALGAAYYTGNFHKWGCAPKGAAILHVRRDRQADLHPAVISHGYNLSVPENPFLREFDWTGTDDPTPMLCIPVALSFLERLAGGFEALRSHCRGMVLEGRRVLLEALSVAAPAPESMVGFLASVPLPDGGASSVDSALYADRLGVALYEKHRIQVPIAPWPAPPKRLVRVSAFLHNAPSDYEKLAAVLPALLRAELG